MDADLTLRFYVGIFLSGILIHIPTPQTFRLPIGMSENRGCFNTSPCEQRPQRPQINLGVEGQVRTDVNWEASLPLL